MKTLQDSRVGETVTVKVNEGYSYQVVIRAIINTGDSDDLTIRSF